jgi:redox-sensitive bicupin YhaK (pirin superfamily)
MSASIKRAFPAFEVDMGGIPVYQPFPTNEVEQIDPFLLLHHSFIEVEKGINPLHAGVGPHPHRGFMPVTYVISGELHHRDSLGNSSVIGAGGAQWLNAGRGMTHSERPSAALAEEGGTAEVIQLWVNTPKKNKMDAPSYRGLSRNKLTHLEISKGMTLDLVSGSYSDKTGPIRSPFPVFFGIIRTSESAQATFDVPKGQKGGVYVIKGSGAISGFGMIEDKHFYEFDAQAEQVELKLNSEAEILVIFGQPIDEPLATYGPFVMNTQTEIMESLRDYNMGKMGILIEE